MEFWTKTSGLWQKHMSITGRVAECIAVAVAPFFQRNIYLLSTDSYSIFALCVCAFIVKLQFHLAIFIWSVRYVNTITLSHSNTIMLDNYTCLTSSNQRMVPFALPA